MLTEMGRRCKKVHIANRDRREQTVAGPVLGTEHVGNPGSCSKAVQCCMLEDPAPSPVWDRRHITHYPTASDISRHVRRLHNASGLSGLPLGVGKLPPSWKRVTFGFSFTLPALSEGLEELTFDSNYLQFIGMGASNILQILTYGLRLVCLGMECRPSPTRPPPN
jgi:hypothetical protein